MVRFLISTLAVLAVSAAVTCHARPDGDRAQLHSASDLAERDSQKDYTHVCSRIASSISPSAVHYPGQFREWYSVLAGFDFVHEPRFSSVRMAQLSLVCVE